MCVFYVNIKVQLLRFLTDIYQSLPVIRRLVRLDDLTLCLDKTDSDGKIRFYHEPLLYRCQLDLRYLLYFIHYRTVINIFLALY